MFNFFGFTNYNQIGDNDYDDIKIVSKVKDKTYKLEQIKQECNTSQTKSINLPQEYSSCIDN